MSVLEQLEQTFGVVKKVGADGVDTAQITRDNFAHSLETFVASGIITQ